MKSRGHIQLQKTDALIVVDIQNDFLPGGNLAVPYGDETIPAMNRYIQIFQDKNLPIFATRDWHPANHCSFKAQGGIWPPHCVQGSKGSEFASDLQLPGTAVIISKAADPEKDSYSGFGGTNLHDQLQTLNVKRLFIGGLATDYCVLNTVKDAISLGYEVHFLNDASRAVNVNPDDGKKAIDEMIGLGAEPINSEGIAYAMSKFQVSVFHAIRRITVIAETEIIAESEVCSYIQSEAGFQQHSMIGEIFQRRLEIASC